MIKIGFDFRMGGIGNAGIGRYSFELLHAMVAVLKSAGLTDQYQFVVFYNSQNASKTDIQQLSDMGVELIAANYRHYSLAEQWAFPRLLGKHNLDLMHFPNFNVPILYRGDYVVTVHDVVHHVLSGHKKSRYHKFLAYKLIINQAVKRAKKVLTVTNAAKAEIEQVLNVPAEKIAVTYEAPTRYQGEAADFNVLKQRYLLSRPYLLFVGTLERKKNLVNLAKGFDILLSKYKYDLDLVIAGKNDPHYPEIREQILNIKHRDNIVFTGFVSDSVQTSLYQNAFAFATASLFEGFGLPGLEAMEYGLPVLAANTEVFNEVYDNAAVFFDGSKPEDIAEKMHLLVNDQPFYELMQKKSLARSAEFDWQKTAKQTIKVYNQVLAQSYQASDNEPEAE